jgi:ubiquinone/menaquinone biosynthesis C-methylase UbiE
MRVLDHGCCAGDVTMLAAELVGTGGAVVGIDRVPEVIDLATKRVSDAGLQNVTFSGGD